MLIVCGVGFELFQGPSILTALLWRSSHFARVVFACVCVKVALVPALLFLWVNFPLRFSELQCLVITVDRVVVATFTPACGSFSLLRHLHTHPISNGFNRNVKRG